MTAVDRTGAGKAEPVRALFIGLGSIGQRHARNLRTMLGNDVRLLAYRARRSAPVVDARLSADTSRSIEDAYEIESFDSLDAALASAPNVAFICNPSSLHVEVALACARAGCDLFIEKPVASELAGLRELVDVVDGAGLVVGVGCQLRFHPAFALLKARIDDGSIGHILAVRAEVGEYLPGWHPYEDYRKSYSARRALGGGVVLTLIHEIDYLLWLFGMPKRIFAVGGHLSSLEIDVEDVVSMVARCERNGRAVPVHLQMDYLRRPPRRSCAVLGDEGSLDFDLRSNRLTTTTPDGSVTTLFDDPAFDRNLLFMAELQDFLEARAARRVPRVSLGSGIEALRVALAVRESVETGTAVDLT